MKSGFCIFVHVKHVMVSQFDNREFAQTVRVAVYVYFWRRPCVMPSIDVYLRFLIHERVDGLHHLRNLIFWTYVSDAKISRAIKNASLDYHQKYTYTATRTGCANYNCDSYVSARQTNTHMTKHYFSTCICVADCDVIYWRLLTSIKCFAYIFTKSL